MKKSNVYRNFIVKIPPAFRQAHIPCEVTDLKLQDAVGQQTHAFLSGEVLTGGWQQFSLHHLLEEGDTCVFELITNKTEDLTFMVHIFHVVEVDHSKVQWQDHYMILSRGDLGQTYDSVTTLQHYLQSSGQCLLYVGDLSYADTYPFDYQVRWDTWSRLIEGSAAYQPWIWTSGNHDIELLPQVGEIKPFKSFKNSFPIPHQASNSTSLLWYSIERGSAHIIVLSSYSAYGEEQ
ncbi:hypothetical protein BDL97_13G014500 [Sphagnum fallax]|nr:hypothetical protein BDL97_13G014500 [Sphagnum fallax]